MFNIKEVDVNELDRRMAGAGLTIVDVRTHPEVAQGTVPNARHIPLNELPARIDEIPDEGDVVIICRSGQRSAQACAWLQSQGKQNVINLRGGIIAWVQQGLAVA